MLPLLKPARHHKKGRCSAQTCGNHRATAGHFTWRSCNYLRYRRSCDTSLTCTRLEPRRACGTACPWSTQRPDTYLICDQHLLLPMRYHRFDTVRSTYLEAHRSYLHNGVRSQACACDVVETQISEAGPSGPRFRQPENWSPSVTMSLHV